MILYMLMGGDELKEDVPTNLQTSLGKGFKMRVFVDSDHTGD